VKPFVHFVVKTYFTCRIKSLSADRQAKSEIKNYLLPYAGFSLHFPIFSICIPVPFYIRNMNITNYLNMKNVLLIPLTMVFLSVISGCSGKQDPSAWNSRQTAKWFEKGEWRNNWQIKPDGSINIKAFAVAYHKNPEKWNKAFTWLKSNDLNSLELKRYDIDGDNVYATVSEYFSKNEEDARYEAHRKYIDIQYVAAGKELIGITPLSRKKDVLEAFDATKDIEYFTVTGGENHLAIPDRFFILFPDDAHRPGLKDGENSPVRKVVVKVKVE